jgi:UDP-N-acetylmuramate dehydrogenase
VPASTVDHPLLTSNAPIKTWFGVGGCARSFAQPTSIQELRTLLAIDPALRVLGDGANLIVDDAGVSGLTIALARGLFRETRIDPRTGAVFAGAGVHLFALCNATLRAGLGGLEVLAGVPASVGGAAVMNAGGAFGQFADTVERVHALTREGTQVTLERAQIDFGYRNSGLNHLIITGADLRLTPGDPAALEERKRAINDYKRRSQPLAAHSAGCCFKNPTLTHDIPGVGARGERVSAGKLIDLAGLKGMRLRSALVSPLHANFLVVEDRSAGKARDVIELMEVVRTRVADRFGVTLANEIVVWRDPAREDER